MSDALTERPLVLHGFGRLSERVASASPYCLKLEAWLRLAGVPYKAVGDFNPFKAPRGKAPWVELPDGRVLADSQVIIDTLRTERGIALDEGVDEDRRQLLLLVQRTLEDHLYFALVHMRWVRDSGFSVLVPHYFGGMPQPMRALVSRMGRRGVKKAAWLQGTSRYSEAEIEASAARDLEAIAWALGDDAYFGGASPCSFDATVYGFLANVLHGPFDDAMKAAAASHGNLVAWCDRLYERCWPPGS